MLWIGANLATTEKRLLYRPRRLYTSGDADFRRALGILLGPPLLGGNQITTLVNGSQIYPAMLNAIRTAQSNITFETFVFRDEIGAVFVAWGRRGPLEYAVGLPVRALRPPEPTEASVKPRPIR